jgi:hypothetical protein
VYSLEISIQSLPIPISDAIPFVLLSQVPRAKSDCIIYPFVLIKINQREDLQCGYALSKVLPICVSHNVTLAAEGRG